MAKTKNTKRDGESRGKLQRKVYEQELKTLQVELCHLQEWVKQSGYTS